MHCACPDEAPILGPDGVNCVEWKYCPLRSECTFIQINQTKLQLNNLFVKSALS